MKNIKAVVLEKTGSRYTVLDENGTFRHVHRHQDAEVGEEIEVQLGSLEGLGGLPAWAGIAAVFILVLTTLFGWNLYQTPSAVAMISLDINPSIQFTIDAQGNLTEIMTKNEDAERLLRKIELKGKPMDLVLEEIVNEAYNQSFLNSERPWIVVGYSPLTESTEQTASNLDEGQIVTWINQDFEETGFTPQVAFFALTPQDRELAQKENLTLGEYALWQTAEKAGIDTQPDKLRDTLERVELLENSKVQAQVKEDKKGLKSPSSLGEGRPSDKGKDQDSESEKQGKTSENLKINGGKYLDGNENDIKVRDEKEKDKGLGNEKDKKKDIEHKSSLSNQGDKPNNQNKQDKKVSGGQE